MTIESGGITTEVIREYEVDEIEQRSATDVAIIVHQDPALTAVTQAVAKAAIIAHHL